VEKAVRALLEIQKQVPRLIVTINPLAWYFDPAQVPATFDRFVKKARAAGLDVVDMRERVPPPPADVGGAWYNLPDDGHWNNAGAKIYGRAIANLILERFPALYAQIRELDRPVRPTTYQPTATADTRWVRGGLHVEQ
jgi:hypothetical protein